jgi:hypothetical protein
MEQTGEGKAEADVHGAPQLAESVDHVFPQSKPRVQPKKAPNSLTLDLMCVCVQDQCHKVPVPLYDILSLNERELTVRVEPMVTVAEITEYLIPKGDQRLLIIWMRECATVW